MLTGKNTLLALITGSTSGIGLSLTRQLLAGGRRVIGLARRPAVVEDPAYTHVQMDLADTAALATWLQDELPGLAPAEAARVELYNNAGHVDPVGRLDQVEWGALTRAVDLGMLAPLLMMRAALALPAREGRVLTHISSGAADKPYGGWGAYCMTRAGLRMASRVLAVDLAGIPAPAGAGPAARIICYNPGPVDTPLQTRVRGLSPERFPGVDRFIRLHGDGMLPPADAVARHILASVVDPDLPEWSEIRFDGKF